MNLSIQITTHPEIEGVYLMVSQWEVKNGWRGVEHNIGDLSEDAIKPIMWSCVKSAIEQENLEYKKT